MGCQGSDPAEAGDPADVVESALRIVLAAQARLRPRIVGRWVPDPLHRQNLILNWSVVY